MQTNDKPNITIISGKNDFLPGTTNLYIQGCFKGFFFSPVFYPNPRPSLNSVSFVLFPDTREIHAREGAGSCEREE